MKEISYADETKKIKKFKDSRFTKKIIKIQWKCFFEVRVNLQEIFVEVITLLLESEKDLLSNSINGNQYEFWNEK